MLKLFAALGFCGALLIGFAAPTVAQEPSVVAIDVALEPDATMLQHARAANAHLLQAFPQGFALDATHTPHITLLQAFVATADLDKVYEATNHALAGEKPADWKLTAFKYYFIPSPPVGLAGIVVEPTADLRRVQQKIIAAVAPYTVKTGTASAFFSTDEGRDIQPFLLEYVAKFVQIGSGEKFNPHVTTGVAPIKFLNDSLAEPFEAFTFSPDSVSIYQLGSFGTARKPLTVLSLKP
jgi:hypothetical protein